jgi:YhcH/YjgK/YiaL family protein
MFVSYIENQSTWHPVLTHQVLHESLEWLANYAESVKFGTYHLGKPDWYANVHGYSTLPEHECCWENHKHTIDIQYIIKGREKIHWANMRCLGHPLRYIEDKDRQEFKMPSVNTTQLVMESGMFAIFLPGDAHCPKIAVEGPESLRKVVIKIPIQLLEK